MSGYRADVGAWSTWFQEARSRIKDLRPAQEAIGKYLVPEFQRHIDEGKGFKALAATTLTPERLRYGTKPLLKTRRMRNAIRYVAGATYCDVGSGYQQSRALFFGYPERNIPARNPLFLTDENRSRIHDIYARHILGVQ